MSKKDYILKLLDLLKEIREPAIGLKLLVESNDMDSNTIDQLYNTLSTAVHNVVSWTQKEKLQKWVEFLEKLKTIEESNRKQDEKDLESLDTLLKNI